MSREVSVLVLARYGPLAASTRYRFLQYLPFLEKHGFSFSVETLLDDDYLRQLYAGESVDRVAVARSYAGRLKTLLSSRRFDLIWMHFDPFPWAPAWFESRLLPRDVPYVVDLDDAMFHRYDQHASRAVRQVLGQKLDSLMRGAAAVVAGNQYLAERAVAVNSQVVEIVPTVVDLERYQVRMSGDPQNSVFNIGWIGSPATTYNLHILRPAMERLIKTYPSRLITVGNGEIDLGPKIEHITRPWSESTEIQDIHGFDVGTMPLVDSPFERGKSGFKLIQCMACGLPVVASPVGVNVEIVENGRNGYLADSPEAWYKALTSLVRDPAMRESMGMAGRDQVEKEYSLQVTAPRLAALLRRAAG